MEFTHFDEQGNALMVDEMCIRDRLLIINPAPLTSIAFDTALMPPTMKMVDQSMAL